MILTIIVLCLYIKKRFGWARWFSVLCLIFEGARLGVHGVFLKDNGGTPALGFILSIISFLLFFAFILIGGSYDKRSVSSVLAELFKFFTCGGAKKKKNGESICGCRRKRRRDPEHAGRNGGQSEGNGGQSRSKPTVTKPRPTKPRTSVDSYRHPDKIDPVRKSYESSGFGADEDDYAHMRNGR